MLIVTEAPLLRVETADHIAKILKLQVVQRERESQEIHGNTRGVIGVSRDKRERREIDKGQRGIHGE